MLKKEGGKLDSHPTLLMPWSGKLGKPHCVSVDVELNLMKTSFSDTQASSLRSRRKKASSTSLKSMKRKTNEKVLPSPTASPKRMHFIRPRTSAGLLSMSNYFFREGWWGRHICFVL